MGTSSLIQQGSLKGLHSFSSRKVFSSLHKASQQVSLMVYELDKRRVSDSCQKALPIIWYPQLSVTVSKRHKHLLTDVFPAILPFMRTDVRGRKEYARQPYAPAPHLR